VLDERLRPDRLSVRDVVLDDTPENTSLSFTKLEPLGICHLQGF
jgi:hypothetical protein